MKSFQKYLQYLFVVDKVCTDSETGDKIDPNVNPKIYLNDDYVDLTILKAKTHDAYRTKPEVYKFMDFKVSQFY